MTRRYNKWDPLITDYGGYLASQITPEHIGRLYCMLTCPGRLTLYKGTLYFSVKQSYKTEQMVLGSALTNDMQTYSFHELI